MQKEISGLEAENAELEAQLKQMEAQMAEAAQLDFSRSFVFHVLPEAIIRISGDSIQEASLSSACKIQTERGILEHAVAQVEAEKQRMDAQLVTQVGRHAKINIL